MAFQRGEMGIGARSRDIQSKEHPGRFDWENGRWVAAGEG